MIEILTNNWPLLLLILIAVVGHYTFNSPRQYGINGNPYSYITRDGAFGTDFDKMIKEDPEYFEKHYLSKMRQFRKHFEARGHKFENGRITPPITMHD